MASLYQISVDTRKSTYSTYLCLDMDSTVSSLIHKKMCLFRDANTSFYLFSSFASSSSTLRPAVFALLNYERPAKLLSYVKEDRCPFLAVDTASRKGFWCKVHAWTCACAYVSAFSLNDNRPRKEEIRKSTHSFCESFRGPFTRGKPPSNFFFTEGAVSMDGRLSWAENPEQLLEKMRVTAVFLERPRQ